MGREMTEPCTSSGEMLPIGDTEIRQWDPRVPPRGVLPIGNTVLTACSIANATPTIGKVVGTTVPKLLNAALPVGNKA